MVRTKKSQAPGAGVEATWHYTLASVVFLYVTAYAMLLLLPAESIANAPTPASVSLIVLIAVCGAVQIRWSWFVRVGLGGGLPSTSWLAALLLPALGAWSLAFVVPDYQLFAVLPLWLGASLLVCLVPKAQGWRIITGAAVVTLLPILVNLQRGAANWDLAQDFNARLYLITFYAVVLPPTLLMSLWFWRIVLRLDESRLIAGELAVTQERLRFAADLHDIQGHHLQVIALKSELAERLLATDPAQAAHYLSEVRTIAKEAMEETRALVAGLREVTLTDEIANAGEVLELTGATCSISIGALPADLKVHRILALAVREATTNILRHANATTVQLDIFSDASGSCLRVVNNGLGAVSATSNTTPGSGISGLRDRVQAFGGTLVTALDHGADSFTFTMWVPHDLEGPL